MDPTVDPGLRSFVELPADSPFPIQNLPYGIFTPASDPPGPPARVGVAIGAAVLDLSILAARGLLDLPELSGRRVFAEPALNAFMALGPPAWRAVRVRLSDLLRADVPTLRDDAELRAAAFFPQNAVTMQLPCRIGDYTDFYAGRHHAMNVGRIFRGPDATLPPQYLHLPIAYHGRSSSLVVSGTPIRRPCGQYRPSPAAAAPEFGPTRELDFELELGALIGVGNTLGTPIPVAQAEDTIFGFVLVNDWSARDIQQWEYQPLGPFLGKNFATTISPWVVPLAALEPFRCSGPPQSPEPLPYLRSPSSGHFAIDFEVRLQAPGMPQPVVISRTNARELYWSFAQMIAHHTVNGCNLRTGDLLASGTISGEAPGAYGSLLELSRRGQTPLALPDGTQRSFLRDGDTLTLTGACGTPGRRIGFGECRGRVAGREQR
ncbi:MAG: fumarylacetoacetase [Planctomycetota bacterium]